MASRTYEMTFREETLQEARHRLMKKYEEMAEKGVRSLDGIPGFAVRRLPFFLVRPIFKLFRVKIEIKLDPENDLATWRFKVGPRVLIEEELPTLMRFVQTVREETGGRSSPARK